jgi:hypothetical protein
MKLLDYFAAFLRDTVNLSDEKLDLLALRVDDIEASVSLGDEAARVEGGLRGKLEPGTIEKPESTSYRGKHWIECYIVKDDVLLASDHRTVLIV